MLKQPRNRGKKSRWSEFWNEKAWLISNDKKVKTACKIENRTRIRIKETRGKMRELWLEKRKLWQKFVRLNLWQDEASISEKSEEGSTKMLARRIPRGFRNVCESADCQNCLWKFRLSELFSWNQAKLFSSLF